jgi:hypothetical protein
VPGFKPTASTATPPTIAFIGSHPTKSLMVVDAKDGTVLGNVDLGGTPEQTVGDGKGTIYQVLQERLGGVAWSTARR